MNWKSWVILTGALILGGLIGVWQLSPRVLSHQPAEAELHGRQPLSVEFSQAMNPASVEPGIKLTPPQAGELTWNEDFDQITFTPSETWPAGQSVALEINKGIRSSIWLPMLRAYRTTLQISPYLLTYLWPAEGSSNLYAANPESGESQALTEEKNGVLDYFLPPDGLSIIYSRSNEDGTSSILVLDRITSLRSILVDCRDGLCRFPQLSPDGTLLAYEFISSEGGILPGIRVYNLNDQTIINPGAPNEYLENPLWGSSGWLAFYNQTRKGYIFWQPVTEQHIFLPNDTGGDGSWSPDGRYFICSQIQFTSQTLAPRHLILFDTREEVILDLSDGSLLEDLNPSFSPIGATLAYSRKSLDPQNWSPGRQLWVMDVNTGDNQQLTDSVDHHHSSFTWHPDGESLAFVRYNQAALTEPPEIWLIDKDGTGKMRLIINGYAPGWIP